MIVKRTVLVLGAGASLDYGFPSGRNLTDKAAAALADPAGMVGGAMQELGHSPAAMSEFRSALKFSGSTSVDAFLEHRREFMEIGKAVIAAILIPFEDGDRLYRSGEHWYEYLIGKLRCPIADFGCNTLSVVTFNYDRSLEFYLHTCLKNSYGLDDSAAAKALETIPVIHVHGTLGRLPWQSGSGECRAYEPQLTAPAVRAAASAIRIVHEASYEDSEFVRARTILAAAESIVFLGFGYLAQNIERLGIDFSVPHFLGGSAFGFKDLEQIAIRRRFEDKIKLGHEHYQVLGYLRERVDLN